MKQAARNSGRRQPILNRREKDSSGNQRSEPGKEVQHQQMSCVTAEIRTQENPGIINEDMKADIAAK